ncbi:hypothetical protein CCP3SC15_60028 [Gammaproteobacteria bacterium]
MGVRTLYLLGYDEGQLTDTSDMVIYGYILTNVFVSLKTFSAISINFGHLLT